MPMDLIRIALTVVVASLPTSPPGGTVRPPLELEVTVPPEPVTIGGRVHLVYELHLRSVATRDLRIVRVEVLPDGPSPALADYGEADVPRLLGQPGGAREDGSGSGSGSGSAAPGVLAAGGDAVVYLWIPLEPGREVPERLRHRVTLRPVPETAPETATDIAVEGAEAPIRGGLERAPLGPPLRGGPWVAVYAPELERGHRRVLLERDGRVTIPARFAIDWMRVDAQGRLARGDAALVANHYGYGAEVLAVADAVVVAARDGVAERTRLSHVSHGLELASGNYVTLDLGDGRFVSYEHLSTGSVRVAPGDRVRRGQVIARLGYSGDGSSPHLHLHVSDGPDPLAGEGRPWTLEAYELLGSYPSLAAFAAATPWESPAPGEERVRHHEMPGPNRVVRFPD